MSVTLTAVVFASDQGDTHATLDVRRRTSRLSAPHTDMTLYADGGWTRDGSGATLALDVERVDRALSVQLGYRRVEGSEWRLVPVRGGREWHATIERLPVGSAMGPARP